MTTEHNAVHEVLSSKFAVVVSWLSAALGIGTFMGFVNTLIGILSACYLTVQIWNYFTHTRKQNALELQLLERRVRERRVGDRRCEITTLKE